MIERSRLSQGPTAQSRGPVRAGVTSGVTDTESGNDDAGVERDLYALKALYDRGLIPKEVFERRKAELMGTAGASGA